MFHKHSDIKIKVEPATIYVYFFSSSVIQLQFSYEGRFSISFVVISFYLHNND